MTGRHRPGTRQREAQSCVHAAAPPASSVVPVTWPVLCRRPPRAQAGSGRVTSSRTSRTCRYGCPVARVIPISQVRLTEA